MAVKYANTGRIPECSTMAHTSRAREHDFQTKYAFLNPAYGHNMVDRYDLGHGYEEHLISCVKQSGGFPPHGLDDLTRRGFEVVTVLDKATSDDLAQRARQAGDQVDLATLKQEEVRGVLGAIFSEELDAKIKFYFQSHYAVIFFMLFQTLPIEDNDLLPEEASVSWGWHCDGGPRRHLKMMVYLNPKDEHDAATEFLDRATTELFNRIGYVFCPLVHRVSDLSDLAEHYGIDYEPVRISPDAGEAIVFEPAAALHRGAPPTFGARSVLQLGLIPSPVPWQDFFQKNYQVLVINQGAAFPNLRG